MALSKGELVDKMLNWLSSRFELTRGELNTLVGFSVQNVDGATLVPFRELTISDIRLIIEHLRVQEGMTDITKESEVKWPKNTVRLDSESGQIGIVFSGEIPLNPSPKFVRNSGERK